MNRANERFEKLRWFQNNLQQIIGADAIMSINDALASVDIRTTKLKITRYSDNDYTMSVKIRIPENYVNRIMLRDFIKLDFVYAFKSFDAHFQQQNFQMANCKITNVTLEYSSEFIESLRTPETWCIDKLCGYVPDKDVYLPLTFCFEI